MPTPLTTPVLRLIVEPQHLRPFCEAETTMSDKAHNTYKCARRAAYSLQNLCLCKQHMGEKLIEIALGKGEAK